MSRSYKKSPVCTDGKARSTSRTKKYANKIVRRCDEEIPNGNFYKRLFCSYEIHDFITRQTWEEAKENYETAEDYIKNRYLDKEDFYNKHWAKYYKRK